MRSFANIGGERKRTAKMESARKKNYKLPTAVVRWLSPNGGGEYELFSILPLLRQIYEIRHRFR